MAHQVVLEFEASDGSTFTETVDVGQKVAVNPRTDFVGVVDVKGDMGLGL